jgi:hypothetical protein
LIDVIVLAVERRKESAAYKSAIERLASAITILGKKKQAPLKLGRAPGECAA